MAELGGRSVSVNPARLSTCPAMAAWARPGINTRPHGHPCPPGPMLFQNAWAHTEPHQEHRTGMGSCVSQVCMGIHGPLNMRAPHHSARWFHGRPGPYTHDKGRSHMFSPSSSTDACHVGRPVPGTPGTIQIREWRDDGDLRMCTI